LGDWSHGQPSPIKWLSVTAFVLSYMGDKSSAKRTSSYRDFSAQDSKPFNGMRFTPVSLQTGRYSAPPALVGNLLFRVALLRPLRYKTNLLRKPGSASAIVSSGRPPFFEPLL